MSTPDTVNFGLTRIGPGEGLQKDGHKALDADRVTLDALLKANQQHTHDGEERLADPVGAPTAVASPTDGTLPGNVTYYYSISYLDEWGLETAASPEVQVTTQSMVNAPAAPTLAHVPTGGTLGVGTYQYLITFADLQGGETTPSLKSSILLTSDVCVGTSQITLNMPAPPLETPCINIYRQKPGQSQFYFLEKITNSAYTDDGSVAEDITLTPPVANTTSSTSSITITAPEVPIPAGVTAWRIYRTTISGNYPASALVHAVVETTDETGTEIVTTWVDTGTTLLPGRPKIYSSTIAGGPNIAATAVTTAAVGNFSAVNVQAMIGEISAFFAGAKGYVEHGADDTVARPTGYGSIEWIGSVEPLNAIDGDTWVQTT